MPPHRQSAHAIEDEDPHAHIGGPAEAPSDTGLGVAQEDQAAPVVTSEQLAAEEERDSATDLELSPDEEAEQ